MKTEDSARAGALAILAYGSLNGDPSEHLARVLTRRINAKTPFPVEYARLSGSRGGAPTLVPHVAGSAVAAKVLVLTERVTEAS
jgi:hypothetical protein